MSEPIHAEPEMTDEQLAAWLDGEFMPSAALQMAAIDELIEARSTIRKLTAPQSPIERFEDGAREGMEK